MRRVSLWLAIGMLGAASSAAAAPAPTIYMTTCLQSNTQITVGGDVCTGGTGTVLTVPACGNLPITWANYCAGFSGCQTTYGGSCQNTYYGATFGKQGFADRTALRRAQDTEDEATWNAHCECPIDGGVTWP